MREWFWKLPMSNCMKRDGVNDVAWNVCLWSLVTARLFIALISCYLFWSSCYSNEPRLGNDNDPCLLNCVSIVSQITVIRSTEGSTLCKTTELQFKGTESIARFHMTSRRPCWCTKTKKWRPYWCTRLTHWELNSIFMQILSFVLLNQHDRWSREWKRSIVSWCKTMVIS